MAADASSLSNIPIQSIAREISSIESITDSRERLLAAGLHVVLNTDLSLLVNGIAPETVTEVAQRSRRNFYDHFESKDAFVVELFERFLLDEAQFVSRIHPTTPIVDIPDGYGDFRAEVASWFSLETLEAIEIFAVLMAMVGLQARASAELSDIVRRHGEIFERLYLPRYEATIAEWNIELAPGWSPLRLAIVVRAFVDGFLMRHRPSMGDLTAANFHLLTEVLVGIFRSASTNGERDGVGAKAAFVRAANQTTDAASRGGASRVVDLRQVVQDVLLDELNHIPPEALTLDYLAERAGVSANAVRREVESTRALTFKMVGDIVTLVEGALLDDLEEAERRDSSRLTVVTDHLLRVRRFAAENMLLLRCLAFSTGPTPAGDGPIERLIDSLAQVLAAHPGPLLVGPGALAANDAARLLIVPLLGPASAELQRARESTEAFARHCVANDSD